MARQLRRRRLNSSIDNIRGDVRAYVEHVLENAIYNIDVKELSEERVASRVAGYDPNWCVSGTSAEQEDDLENAFQALVDYEVKSLMGDYPER